MSPLSTATISGQPGPQTEFLRTAADICIYGGAAGGGKTVGLIPEPLRHVGRVANFTAVFFRRTTPQITNPGGLWDESLNFYPRLGGTPHLRAQEWRWPCGGKIKFSHLQLATTVYDWQGAQITLICFDELTHFTAHQFFYLLSRNRSTCGVRPYIRATCNPDADSWVAEFLAWWIDPETGFPIPERAGVLRYYVRVSGKIIWADQPEDLVQHLPPPETLPPGVDPPRPISVTFIPASVFDNPALLKVNPVTFTYHLDRNRLRRARRREGRYLLRTNLTEDNPAKLWNLYLLLVRVEEAFENLKGDLAIRPIFHQDQARIEAHIFIAFLAYCLHATLARRLHALAPGLSPRSVIEKFAAMQMIDVHVPTTDGRELLLTRYTEPDAELRLLLDKLKLALPAQSPPKITTAQIAPQPPP